MTSETAGHLLAKSADNFAHAASPLVETGGFVPCD
jgi:hypothetical protein